MTPTDVLTAIAQQDWGRAGSGLAAMTPQERSQLVDKARSNSAVMTALSGGVQQELIEVGNQLRSAQDVSRGMGPLHDVAQSLSEIVAALVEGHSEEALAEAQTTQRHAAAALDDQQAQSARLQETLDGLPPGPRQAMLVRLAVTAQLALSQGQIREASQLAGRVLKEHAKQPCPYPAAEAAWTMAVLAIGMDNQSAEIDALVLCASNAARTPHTRRLHDAAARLRALGAWERLPQAVQERLGTE